MELLTRIHLRWRPVLVAATVVLSMATIASAQLPLIIDGRDEANLANEGNWGTYHNPPVQFAFTFLGVAADNPTVGPGDPPMACCDKSFNFIGTDFGGLGFGISPDVAFPVATSYALLDLTVNAANTLPYLNLNLKDRDFVPPIFSNIEEHQWAMPLGGPGTKRIKIWLGAPPSFTGNPSPPGSVGQGPDFDPSLGLTEVQLQYPYGESCQPGGACTGAILDVTIHRFAIVAIPEPATLGMIAIGAVLIGGIGTRRRR
jgi:hypothetical protein